MWIPLATKVADLRVYFDDDDWELVLPYRWGFSGFEIGYAVTHVGLYTLYMHRLIMGVAKGDPRHVDHVNRNRLDNRRSNLEVMTQAQNNQNTSPQRRTSSRYRGVTWYKNYGCWRAQAKMGGRGHHIGYFDSEEDAALAAAEWRAKNMPYSAEARAARAAH